MCHYTLDPEATLLVKCTAYLRTRDPLLCEGKRWTNPTSLPNITYIESERAIGLLQKEEDAYYKVLHLRHRRKFNTLIYKRWKASRERRDFPEELDLKTHRVPLSCGRGGVLKAHERMYTCPRGGSRWTDGVWATAEAHTGAQRDAEALDERLEGIFRGIEAERGGGRVRFCDDVGGVGKGKGEALYEKMVRDEERIVRKWRVWDGFWTCVRRMWRFVRLYFFFCCVRSLWV